jgi:hydrogenase maturation protease
VAEAWVVIGVGNPDRGDDGIGHRVIDHLEGSTPPGTHLVRSVGADPASLMAAWDGVGKAIVVDAMVSGGRAGRVRRFDVRQSPLPADVSFASTHALGTVAAVELARALERLPDRITVFGVEGYSFEPGSALSAAAAAGAELATRMIKQEVAHA